MPNWCACDLIIEGPSCKVDAFLRFARCDEVVLDFGHFLPYPAHFQELDRKAAEWDAEHPGELEGRPADGYNQGGYDWCMANWGTKWNARKPELNEEGGQCWTDAGTARRRVEINFATAWSAPKPVVQRAAELFPELTFELRNFERGEGFSGMLRCGNGVVLADLAGDYCGDRGG
jgi:hypothetical protein